MTIATEEVATQVIAKTDDELVEQWATTGARTGESPFFKRKRYSKLVFDRCYRINYFSVDMNKIIRSLFVEVVGEKEKNVAILG